MREDDASEEQSQNEDDRRSVFDRAKGVIGSARRQVSRSVDVVTGEDIRRFDEFTDATTRAVVGVHQDLSELREEFGRTHRAVDDIHERQEHLTERLDQLEQSVGAILKPSLSNLQVRDPEITTMNYQVCSTVGITSSRSRHARQSPASGCSTRDDQNDQPA